MQINHRIQEGELLWQPTPQMAEQANLRRYMLWLERSRRLTFRDYHQLWQWSVDEPEAFWESLWHYFDISASRRYLSILNERVMPGARWFAGSQLNFAEHLFREAVEHEPAIIFRSETEPLREVSWEEFRHQTARLALALRGIGVKPGDRVAAYIPNIPEAIFAFAATASIGAVWSGCSPDFGTDSVIDRFSQIEPVVLISVDGYHYGGKSHNRIDRLAKLQNALPTVRKTILLPYLADEPDISSLPGAANTVNWHDLPPGRVDLTFTPVPFDHPLWILYSSGTTGLPKPIVHGHGGMLLEHLKYMEFHADVRSGDRFFWYSTTGWMMWNVVVAALLRGSTAVIYDGSPGYPDLNALWQFAEDAHMTNFGTSAAFLTSCMKAGLNPGATFDLSRLRSVGSTGSPLPPEGYAWVYEHVSPHVMLNSTSGGTDICSSFVGGNPTLPVYAGEIQCRILGSKVEAWDENGRAVIDEVGEMVITQPMPCMPIRFWGDADGSRYRESYFDHFPGVWRHGDWIKITSRDTCIIYGRSDATLNKQGVRIGTSEIYRAVEMVPAVADSLVVCYERPDGTWHMPLFVVLREGNGDGSGEVPSAIRDQITANIRERIAPRFVPDEIIAVPGIPYTLSGKKMEQPVLRILTGTPAEEAASRDAMKNPGILTVFAAYKDPAINRAEK
ncbi:MAG: acetoacetate--CoA ligase [Balneolaceae bacterium]|nr:MAG: acetoacetate--CoA ligase [Balneolaceae bacterium]